MTIRVLSIFGTRPEAIKMAPVIAGLEADARFESIVAVTAQHRDMLDQVLEVFSITPHFDLDIMTHGQTLAQITQRVLAGIDQVLEEVQPDIVLVHGDTTTTFAATLAAVYRGIAVGHIEAGMRTGDITQPFPEELNRVLVARMARWHFAPSKECQDNLLREGVDPQAIIRTQYNTGVAALLLASKLIAPSEKGSKSVLITAHRRESWGEPMREIFSAIAEVAAANPQYTFNVATHANPIVATDAAAILGAISNVNLIGPQSYADFINLMASAELIMSDSGGVQEEGPTLGVPVVVLRNKTEYHELLDAGVVHLAGTDQQSIVETAQRVLHSEEAHKIAREFSVMRATTSTIEEILGVLADFKR